MQFINPNRGTRPGLLTAANRRAITTAIANWDATQPSASFDDLRKVLPAAKRAVTDGELHQLLIDNNIAVES